MSRDRFVDAILIVPAFVAVVVEDYGLRPAIRAAHWFHRASRLERLHRRLAKLPPGAALPLFLIPEAASRAGWFASAWLLMTGAGWEALTVYVLTKLFATVTALWVYRACEPALLRVKWFARIHATVQRMRLSVVKSSPRFAALRQRVRVSTLR